MLKLKLAFTMSWLDPATRFEAQGRGPKVQI